MHGPSGPYPTSEFEHSSIAATVKKIFNLKDFLTRRDAWAGTFECVLNTTRLRTDCPVTLPEPVKMRETEAKEDANLSDFQEQIVLMSAALSGDHVKDTYPHKLVENMVVSQAVKYVVDVFQKFCNECEIARKNGVDESEIVCLANPPARKTSKSLAHKIFSCLICDH
ncbi:hypothetical protein CFOL_v3_32103 [Cephalotus follicularis]|uniref:Uncharacterized protein n=1 Tax=Cephalotus follicularis TaxID=3775 RepID=A0A1Q3D8B7_CEPFO|nr:hypothetical protein CFOL_v3_32103 [Cephalotus follicularis]